MTQREITDQVIAMPGVAPVTASEATARRRWPGATRSSSRPAQNRTRVEAS
jgi:hypothetical protein